MSKFMTSVSSPKTKGKPKLPSGFYTSTVKAVEEPDDYKAGTVVKVTYELIDENGEVFSHSELFILNAGNQRTRDIEEYLASQGMEEWKDFVGCREKVEIRKNPSRYGGSLPTIVDRQFLGREEEEQ